VWRPPSIARLATLIAVAGSLLPAACSRRPAAATLHELAEQYVRVTLQLAQHRPNLVDAWTGPADWQPGRRIPVAELRVVVDGLVARADDLRTSRFDPTDAPRVAYLQGQMRALSLVTRRLLGDTTTFSEEARTDFGRPLPTTDEEAMTRARTALDLELEGDGPLEHRYTAFRRQFVVDRRRGKAVFGAAIDACRAATSAHLVLPPDERIALAFDEAIEWDAYARYRGAHETLLTIGGASEHDVAALLHMACHETYAGHHAQHILIDDALVKGRGWMEFHLTPSFGPHRLISEGAAEAGVGLALPEAARARIYRERLLPLAGLPVREAERLARVETLASSLEASLPDTIGRYLDNQASAEETVSRLATQALISSPERFLALAERHRVGAVVYPVGKAVVSAWVAGGSTADEQWRRLQDLFTRRPFALD
jgi:hypothetical protein